MSDGLIPNPDGTYAMPDVVWIALGNLEPGVGYRTQLREMEELENSIRQFGVLTPLWVQPDPNVQNRYIIFAGRRRYEAAKRIARERCDPSLDKPVATQVGEYVVPCRVFRDLVQIQQALLTLTENVARRDPSAVDTACELRRIKDLYEAEMGRPVKVDQILTMLCGARSDHKIPGRRHLYRLLRIGELDAEVAAAAKERRLAYGFLDQVARLPEISDQLELIGLIADIGLTRNEAREIVNKRLSTKESSLSSIVAEVTSPSHLSSIDAATPSAIRPESGNGRREKHGAIGAGLHLPQSRLEAVESSAPSGHSAPDGMVRNGTGLGLTNLSALVSQLRSQVDVDLLRAADVLEAWAASEGERLTPGGDKLKQWLADLSERGHDGGEIERLRVAVEREEYSTLEAKLMELLFTCQGVLPEHLPGYVRQIRDAMGESDWYQNLVRCFLELLTLLNQIDENKRLNSTAKRLLDIAFNELFWLAAVYDPKLQYHVEKLPPLKKKAFATIGRL